MGIIERIVSTVTLSQHTHNTHTSIDRSKTRTRTTTTTTTTSKRSNQLTKKKGCFQNSHLSLLLPSWCCLPCKLGSQALRTNQLISFLQERVQTSRRNTVRSTPTTRPATIGASSIQRKTCASPSLRRSVRRTPRRISAPIS